MYKIWQRYGTIVTDSSLCQATNRITWISVDYYSKLTLSSCPPPSCLYKRREHAVLCPQYRTQVAIDLRSAEKILLTMRNVGCNIHIAEL